MMEESSNTSKGLKMAALTRQERQETVKQTLASLALEGFDPNAQYVALLKRYVEGELTLAQVRKLFAADFEKRHSAAKQWVA